MSENTLSSPSMNFAGHHLHIPRSEQCCRPSWPRQAVEVHRELAVALAAPCG